MNIFLLIIFSLLITFTGLSQSKGHLVIIGGGKRTDSIMNKIVQLSGGKDARIVIIPNASSDPDDSGLYLKKEFNDLGCKNVSYIVADSFNINDDKTLDELKDVDCIFFAGGDQNRLTKILLNSRMLNSIKEIYQSGGVISGTSAGAAVMSKIMITGEELSNNDSSRAFNSIVSDNIESAEGFGFIENAIVDQHFIKRKRNNRLISLVLQNPEYLGIGIDESTAAIVYPDNTLEVLGTNQVIFYDASNSGMIKVDSLKNFSASDIRMHILFSGQKFDLSGRSVIE